MARRVLLAEVSGGRVRGRPELGCMEGMKVALGNRGMTVKAKDRKIFRERSECVKFGMREIPRNARKIGKSAWRTLAHSN